MIAAVLLAVASPSAAPPAWLLAPFLLLLACIALGPIAFAHFWHRRYPHVAVGLGAVTAGYYLLQGQGGQMLHAVEEYVGFISLIGSLYVVAGGIHLRVKGDATPLGNCTFLLAGAVLANVIGTTGASMLLIRPWLRMNRRRIAAYHVVFFIFIVSNVGGCLTPIGDPPLFMGYLRGVPFWWVLQHCWHGWLLAVLGLLAIFYVFERRNAARAPAADEELATDREGWQVQGLHNVIYIAAILLAVLALPLGWREAVMVAAGLASLWTTARAVHEANRFTFEPLMEVVWLFIGIFATMVPALQYLQVHPPPLQSHLAFYSATGVLSGVLDNAPTYLAFLATALGQQNMQIDSTGDVLRFAGEHARTLEAISLGAVFFGAMTYIGNGPNFMVKAMAEHARVPTPSFMAYLVRYALPMLLPFLAILGWWLFGR